MVGFEEFDVAVVAQTGKQVDQVVDIGAGVGFGSIAWQPCSEHNIDVGGD